MKLSVINLGDKVEDIISHVTGIVTGRHEFISGCTRFTIHRPVNEKGDIPDSYPLDIQQLRVIEPNALTPADAIINFVELGDIAKDLLTDYEGVVCSRHIYLNGEVNYILQAKMREDGEVPKDRIVPAGFMKILKSKATPEITQRPTGGPERIPKRADAVR